MRKLPLLFIFLFQLSFGQQSKIDSLTVEFYKEKLDTVKAEILAKIGIAAYYIDFNKAKYYNDSLIKFSNGRSKKYEALGYRMQGTLQLIDGKFNYSEESYLKSLNIFKKIKDTAHQGALIANLATLYARQNQIAKADSMYLAAIDILKDVKNNKQAINCYVNLGINAMNANKLELASKYFVETLKKAEETNNKNYQLYAHSQLGVVYLKRKLYGNAQKSLKNAEKIGTEIDDKTGLTSVYNSIGTLYNELKNHQESLKYFLLSKETAELVNDKDQLSKVYINMGKQYEFLNQYINAQKSFEKAIIITLSTQDSSKAVTANLNLAGLLLKMKNIPLAEKNIANANKFMPENPDDDYFMQYKKISDEYAKLDKKSKAYEFLKKYSQAVDSLNSKNDVSKIAEIETKYQTEKKEKENLQLKAKNTEQALLTQKANTRNWLLLFGLLAVGISAFFIFRRYKSEAKARKIISQQKDEIEQQKNLVETLQKELHHRMKNNLSFIDLFISLAKGKFQDPAYQTKLNELQNRMHSMFEVHKQLFKKDDVTTVKAKNYIDTLVENVQKSYAKENITFSNTTHINETILADTSFPVGLIVNEFVTNSYKYAFDDAKQGSIDINLASNPKEYILKLKDNGKGLPKDFNINNLDSFGLETIQLLTQEYGGTFTLNGTNGVTMNITLPKTAA